MFSGQLASSVEKDANQALAHVHCWKARNKLRLTPSKTNSIAYSAVCFVCLGTGDKEARRAKGGGAVQRTFAPKACLAHHTLFLHSALIISRLLPLDIRIREAAWLYKVEHGKDLKNTFLDRELEKPLYFDSLSYLAHVPEIRYDSVEDLES
ncbi:hypothetical protein EVAR_43178_1 [Eumeta japonica]|uniref:Uncharacterized protein n=1 Tax=Eumeta variegata TaxID=151549 RepID=A0A4C1XKT5_EUMVA|nr:hypothetical protein EVAR_43178_1 [Eumeta japonica]